MKMGLRVSLQMHGALMTVYADVERGDDDDDDDEIPRKLFCVDMTNSWLQRSTETFKGHQGPEGWKPTLLLFDRALFFHPSHLSLSLSGLSVGV